MGESRLTGWVEISCQCCGDTGIGMVESNARLRTSEFFAYLATIFLEYLARFDDDDDT